MAQRLGLSSLAARACAQVIDNIACMQVVDNMMTRPVGNADDDTTT
jgi:hypothetical protein